jgi:hypothetical protein
MNQRKQQIEDAYSLIKGIDFRQVIELLQQSQTPELFRVHWAKNTPAIPDKNEVHEVYKERKAGLESMMQDCKNVADQQYMFEDRLFIVARSILQADESGHLNKLRVPDFDILNMPMIGQLWADADILLKYYPQYKGSKLPEALPLGFKTNLAPSKAGALCDALKQAGFIAQGTEPEHLKAVLCGLQIEKRVQWIKRSTRGKTLHKKSLPELIELLGVKTTYTEHRERFAQCFSENGQPMKLNAESWNDNKSKPDTTSEYYKELTAIVKRIKK